ncbi:hypothetical protein [Stappia stellulata]|uniref:hypothetical protein n=1 Tax=Stappia stellulata TaxID=71235 RepID=UPI000425BDD5|nr:hypothetical protein [Stappia stellulata]
MMDMREIERIAVDTYDGLPEMARAHGWSPEIAQSAEAAQRAIVDTYGSLDVFRRAHAGDAYPDPETLINVDPPRVWLTSTWGFQPEDYGSFGFSDFDKRRSFLEEIRPGDLLVIYCTKVKGPPAQRGRVPGLLQLSGRAGIAQRFISPVEWKKRPVDPLLRDRWQHAVEAVRAWIISPDSAWPTIEQFAPTTYRTSRARHIAKCPVRVTTDEARRLFDFNLREVSVYPNSGLPSDDADGEACPAREALRPSKPGPVSQHPTEHKEAEGPKHLYVMRLTGSPFDFLDPSSLPERDDSAELQIFKVGFSHSPKTRCDAINAGLPRDALFRWEIFVSGSGVYGAPLPSSKEARIGEDAMKNYLEKRGMSLGNEFFLCTQRAARKALKRGYAAAGFD